MTLASPVTHADAAVAVLTGGAVSVPVGDAAVPETVGSDGAYVVVYPVDGGRLDGSLGDPRDDVVFPVQVTCVARLRNHAQYLQEAVRGAYLDVSAWSVAGRSVMQVTLPFPSGVKREDDVGEREGRRFYTTDVFNVHTTPA